jgi:hypothetical protein
MKTFLMVLSGVAVAATLSVGPAWTQTNGNPSQTSGSTESETNESGATERSATETEEEFGTPVLMVTDAKLGLGVENREIVDEGMAFNVQDRVYLWMKVTGGPSDPVTVTWQWPGMTFSYDLEIGGNPWRTWAYKTMHTGGDWSVSVADAGGNVLKTMSFTVSDTERIAEKSQ